MGGCGPQFVVYLALVLQVSLFFAYQDSGISLTVVQIASKSLLIFWYTLDFDFFSAIIAVIKPTHRTIHWVILIAATICGAIVVISIIVGIILTLFPTWRKEIKRWWQFLFHWILNNDYSRFSENRISFVTIYFFCPMTIYLSGISVWKHFVFCSISS